LKLDDARELRQELEAVEAAMIRIKELWNAEDFPSIDQLGELASTAAGINSILDDLVAKEERIPSANSLDDLHTAVRGISANMDEIIDKAKQMPSADDVQA